MSKHQAPLNWYTGGGSDTDVNETEEWLTAFEQVVEIEGRDRACFLLKKLLEKGYEKDVVLPFTGNTPYINTIAKSQEPAYAGDRQLERRIKSIVRWNAMAMVVKANRESEGIGGHISLVLLVCHTLRSRFQPLFPRARSSVRRRFGFLPRTRIARRVFAGLLGGPAD